VSTGNTKKIKKVLLPCKPAKNGGFAVDIITERAADYGDPRPNHERIAHLWNAYLEPATPITAHDVAICMVLVKISRAKAGSQSKSGSKPDTYLDMAGYAEIAERLR
jgi:hypothetical protein